MANIIMGQKELYDAASFGDIGRIYQVIQQNAHILEVIDQVPFINTPMHTAAFAGHLQVALEFMLLKPSFGSKLNEDGFTPIHLAVQNNHNKLVRRLVKINNDLVRVKGRNWVTPLHLVIKAGESEENNALFVELFEACPDSIEDLDVRGETPLHVALQHENSYAFEYMFKWLVKNKGTLDLGRSILNWKNIDENTILHIATIKNNQEAVDLLMTRMVDIKAKNFHDQTALDLAQAGLFEETETKLLDFIAKCEAEDKPKSLLVRWYDAEIALLHSEVSEEQRNAFMIVAGLFIAAIYQTVMSPVGGLTQGGSDTGPNTTAAGKSVLSHKYFAGISFLNTYIFSGGVLLIIHLMPKSPPLFRMFSAVLLCFLSLSYLISMFVIKPSGSLL